LRAVAVGALLVVVACGGGGGDRLADGTHFGFVTEVDVQSLRIQFDPAELLAGEDAVAAAEADGGVVTERGSYVRNPERQARRVTLGKDVRLRLLRPCCELTETSFDEWVAGFEPDDRTFYGTSASRYELTIDDGKVVAIDEVYVR
jgi:hypothetical protein